MASTAEFIALCRSQVNLLANVWGADVSAIYLANMGEESKLVPVIVYPDDQDLCVDRVLASLPSGIDQFTNQDENLSPSLVLSSPKSQTYSNLFSDPRQMWLPLIYQEQMLGLLVTKRYLRPWTIDERQQIEQIAATITFACALERRYLWTENKLGNQLKLQEKQRDILHNLLHQVRNPLTAIRTFGKLLVRRLLPEDPNRDVSNHIIRESDRVEELLGYLSQILDQERELLLEDVTPDLQKLLPSSEPQQELNNPLNNALTLPIETLVISDIKLDEILLPLIASAKEIASDRQIKLVNKLPVNLPIIKGNVAGLREVFSNLLDNAIKYTPDRGRVTIESIKRNHRQGIKISDNGLGIPAEDLAKLFTRGYRGRQALGNIPGTGLGLAIVKDLLTAMGGQIEVKSKVKTSPTTLRSGTVVTVWVEIVNANE